MSFTFSIDLTDGAVVPCLLYTVTRRDGTIERVTNAQWDVTIGADTWSVMGGLRAGTLTQRNDGTPPVMGFDIVLTSAGKFRFRNVVRGLYEKANVLVQLTDAANPVTTDFVFEGSMLGTISYNIAGKASFELISKYAIPRDLFVKVHTLGCDHMFGDPLTCNMPIFPYDVGNTQDMTDVARGETIATGRRRRFRFAGAGTPEDYANVYLEATTGGITHASVVPSFSSTVGSVIVDGTVTFVTRNAWARAVRIAATDGLRILTMDRDPDPRGLSDTTWYHPAKLMFVTGEYAGRVFSGGNWGAGARTLQVYLNCPFAAVNDWAELSPSCDRTHTMCYYKYANARKHGGNPFSMGAKAQAQQLGLDAL